jgi:hypothetical protein
VAITAASNDDVYELVVRVAGGTWSVDEIAAALQRLVQ